MRILTSKHKKYRTMSGSRYDVRLELVRQFKSKKVSLTLQIEES
jgi:hypothetical protein